MAHSSFVRLSLVGTFAFQILSHAAVPPEAAMLGVNISGGEFGHTPGKYAYDYAYPKAEQYDYFKAHGLAVVRLPFKWERVQRAPMGPLDEAEMKRLDETVALARTSGIRLMLDLHNFGKYGSDVVGSEKLPPAAMADVWKKLAAHYADEPAIFAYSIMNEPTKMLGRWPAYVQETVDAIRSVDTNHTISVCGENWSGAHSWKKSNANLLINDPASNLIYEAHQYFDRDNSGTYKQGYDDSGANATNCVPRLQPFLDWLKENNVRGFIGEFGVPNDDPRWLVVLDNVIAALKANNVGGTYWAAGAWWGKYPLSVEPREGRDRPQMQVLSLYAGEKMKPADAKPAYATAAAAMEAAGQRMVFNFRTRDEAYHFSNKETSYAAAHVFDAGQDARKISYQHTGSPAYVGVGLFFGGLKCAGYSSFVLAARAEKPCKVDVKVYPVGSKQSFVTHVSVTTDWQEVSIPFDQLTGSAGTFDASQRIEKMEFNPGVDTAGNSLYFGELKLAR